MTKQKNPARLAYLSAIVIIVVLVTFTQLAIQLTLYEAGITRDYATLLNRQELRVQRILRSSLLLLAPDPKDKSLNPLQVDPSAQLKDDLAFTQETQGTLSGGNVAVADDIRALAAEYQAMHEAGTQVLDAAQKHDRKALASAIAPLFLHEQKYLTGVYTAYVTQTQDADAQVNLVRWIELTMYAFSLIVIVYEVFGVVLPVYREQQAENDELRVRVDLLQTAINAKRQQRKSGEEREL
jgi:hypothetical protein